MSVADATGCSVANGRINVSAECVTIGCTLSTDPLLVATSVPGVGWALTSVKHGTYALTVALPGCRTSKNATVGPNCASSVGSEDSVYTSDDTGPGIAWWAWLVLGIGVVLVAAIIVGAIFLGRHISDTRRNNVFFSGSTPDEGIAVLGGLGGTDPTVDEYDRA